MQPIEMTPKDMNSSESDGSQKHQVHSVDTSAFRSPEISAKPTKTLLVVDDEEAVLDLMVDLLRQQGYTVLQSGSAMEALRLATTTATIHLLITDLLMPEINGIELTRRFRVVHPKTPVLIVSGSVAFLEMDLEHIEFLAKPFESSELLHKVHRLLHAAPLA